MPRKPKIPETHPDALGHRVEMRNTLRQEREARKWSAQKVAELITEKTGEPLSDQSIYYWEQFRRHPSIDSFAVWARVLDHRLYVDLVPDTEEYAKVPVRRDQVPTVRLMEQLAPEDLKLVSRLVDVLPRLAEEPGVAARIRRILEGDIEDGMRDLVRTRVERQQRG